MSLIMIDVEGRYRKRCLCKHHADNVAFSEISDYAHAAKVMSSKYSRANQNRVYQFQSSKT